MGCRCLSGERWWDLGYASRISAAVLSTRCCHSGTAERCRSRDSRKSDAIPPIRAATLDQIAAVTASCDTESDAETPDTPPIRKPAMNRPKAVRRHRFQIVSTRGFIRLRFKVEPHGLAPLAPPAHDQPQPLRKWPNDLRNWNGANMQHFSILHFRLLRRPRSSVCDGE
jgi:hypothetical protein